MNTMLNNFRSYITSLAVLAILGAVTQLSAQQENIEIREIRLGGRGGGVVGGPGSANFDLAARFAPYKIQKMVHSTTVSPSWIEGSERFWYEWEDSDGTSYNIVDPVRGTKSQLFDNDRIAAELTRITLDPWDGQHLPIRNIRFIDENTLQFDVESSQDEDIDEEEEVDTEEEQEEEDTDQQERSDKKMYHFEYDVGTQTLRELEDYESPNNHPGWANVSPDGETVVFARNYNLWMISGSDYELILDARRGESGDDADEAEEDVEVEEIQLTTDGEEFYAYGGSGGRGETNVTYEENMDDRKRAGVVWSKDSQKFALVRRDQREVGDLWVVHAVGNKRPELETYKYDMPGEENVTQSELLIYDLAARNMVQVEDDPWKDQMMSVTTDRQFVYPDSDEPRQQVWLSDNSDELWFTRTSRDRKRTDVMIANAATGEVQTIIEDRLNTYMETRNVEKLDNGDLLWWSERDGWAHIYRYGSDGTLKNRVTEGPWHVDGIAGVDNERGYVFVLGQGHESGEDPYYQHLYRVNLDGSGLTLLNPGDFDHRVNMGESSRFFVESYSRVNTTPSSGLFSASGEKILDLETADFSALTEAGYEFPELFKAEADDGVTDMYGVMYKPYDFDPSKKYPIVALCTQVLRPSQSRSFSRRMRLSRHSLSSALSSLRSATAVVTQTVPSGTTTTGMEICVTTDWLIRRLYSNNSAIATTLSTSTGSVFTDTQAVASCLRLRCSSTLTSSRLRCRRPVTTTTTSITVTGRKHITVFRKLSTTKATSASSSISRRTPISRRT